MRSMLTLTLLLTTLVLLGSECEQPLFPAIECETDADCVTPCSEECEAIGEVLLSAECDANLFCDCMCREGAGGMGGEGGFGGDLGPGGVGGG
ncbi:MAG: hypothetical protein AAGF92_07420 [Myxococcota bacterium]